MIDFDALVLAPLQGIYGRPIYVLPITTQPGLPGYWARGDYRVQNIDIETQEGIQSDQTLSLGVRLRDFAAAAPGGIEPGQKDQVFVPAHQGYPEAGPFWIGDVDDDHFGHAVWALKEAPRTARNVPPTGP